MVRTSSLIAIFLLCLSVNGRAEDEISLTNARTIVFYGDNITQNNLYSRLVETFIISRFPHQTFRTFNSGWGGDTATAGIKRFSRDAGPFKPDLVFVNFGMNDGKCAPENTEFTPVQWYIRSQSELNDAIKSGRGRGVFLTTSVIDNELQGSDAYNDTLAQFADELLSFAKQNHSPAVDVFHYMRPLQQNVKAAIPKFALTQDSIHPNIAGALVMAYCVIKRLDASHVGADIVIRNGKLISIKGATLTHFEYAGDQIKFDLTLPFVPLYVRADARTISPFLPIEDELNHFELRIDGWNQTSGCSISVDGAATGTSPAAEINYGIDLALLDGAPWLRQRQNHGRTIKRIQTWIRAIQP